MNRIEQNTIKNIRDLRANFVKRYLSLNLNEKQKPNLYFDVSKLEELMELDQKNRPIWENFITFFKEQDPDQEQFENHQLYKEIIDNLRIIEEGGESRHDFSSLLTPLMRLDGSDQLALPSYLQERNEPIMPVEALDDEGLEAVTPSPLATATEGEPEITQIEIGTDLTDLRELIVAIDNQQAPLSTLEEVEHETLFTQYLTELSTAGYHKAATELEEIFNTSDLTHRFKAVTLLYDLLDALAHNLNSGRELPLEQSLIPLYRSLYHIGAYQTLATALIDLKERLQENSAFFKRRSTQKRLEHLSSLLLTEALFPLTDPLKEALEQRDPADLKAHLTLIDTLLPLITTQQVEVAPPISNEESGTAAIETTGQLHPYYLTDTIEVTLKEAPDYDDELMAELRESFHEEAMEEVFPTLTESLEALKSEPYSEEKILTLRRAFHTLKGSGYMAGYMYEGEIAWQVEQVLNGCRDKNYPFSPAIWHHANDGYHAIATLLGGGEFSNDELGRIAYQAQYLMSNGGIIEPQEMSAIVEQLPKAAVEHIAEERPALETAAAMPEESEEVDTTLSHLKAPLASLQELMAQLRDGSYYDLRDFSKASGQLAEHSPLPPSDPRQALINALHYGALMHRAHGVLPREETITLWDHVVAKIATLINLGETVTEAEVRESVAALKRPIITYGGAIEEVSDETEEESELYELFLEEAVEILELSDELINDWRLEGFSEESELIAEFRRHMHTLKGSARMVGREDIGQLAHAMESLLDPLYISRFNSDPKQFEILQRSVDYLPLMLEQTKSGLNQEGYSLLSALHLILGNETPAELDHEGNVEGEQQHTKVTEKTSTAAQAELSAIRVSPVHLASISEDIAENAILNSQQERTITHISNILEELDRTIARLNMQTRRIEIEMEAQMLSRHARLIEEDDFDPLELDRFTELQQVTRFISESVSDLISLGESINEQTDELNSTLDKQITLNEFVSSALNEIRTVSFLHIVPRLRRLIRQVSKEHGKKVELITEGVEFPVERSIVEQMIAPFEHMIRNSIIHGLESPEERQQQNKAEVGVISLTVIKEDAELLIRFSDDGRGIDVEKVRQKVIEMGAIDPDASYSDQEIVEMLMLPGMTTAESLSQDAGRGVGLDVFAKAVLLLNADFQIINNPGEGLTFEVRVPFTLSTIKSLIVKSGRKHYAIPLNHVVAVDNQLEVDDEGYLFYQGEHYRNYHLGAIYRDLEAVAQRNEEHLHILLNINDKRYALEIDEISSQEEIIMRPLNPQIASTPGLSGASVLSNGEIVFIVDVNKLFNSELISDDLEVAVDALTPTLEESIQNHIPKVLVVDDSITMRRVSSRLVERLGLRYETAKDGLDAIEKVEQEIPDLIMLDIEMPNMDGFEVLSYLKSQSQFHDIPIIMITSRIGEKHKERALELGANMYCGKPYSEEEMNQNIRTLLADKIN